MSLVDQSRCENVRTVQDESMVVLVCEYIAVTTQAQQAYADWRRSVYEPWLRQHGSTPDGSRTLLDTPEGGPT
jgi:hypothetical protein